ncbi:hypothetical protein ABXT21_19675 [Ralstonia sp. SM1864_UCD524_TZ4]|uniref:DUF1795 domain-containing protein n=2 Tax=Ralstonia TaxID=48736 RepID=A0A0S4UKY4_RALSL|nr:exported protein of unknown function [Ralstonia solanacearum]CUV32529.1 exported protein of unknown function [Ralstonia solanacearum]CUV40631.1 exported protein of unknown function [Ralstonia solanacearum]CUV60708.1 exported protein of unknown function [Ralstonia solanacearum]
MQKFFAALFLMICGLAHADSMIDTPDFKLNLPGDWAVERTKDASQHSLYSKQQDVGITASSMHFKRGVPDLRRIADKLVETRLAAENSAGREYGLHMTIAEPIVVPFARGFQVAYYGHDSTNRQFRYLGVVVDGRIVSIYAESKTKSQQELENQFNQLLKGLTI